VANGKNFTNRQVETAKPGRVQVTGTTGLYLVVNDNGDRRFLWRFVSPRTLRPSETGLGTWPLTSLADARERVAEMAKMVRRGEDPVTAKRAVRRTAGVNAFDDLLDRYVRNHNREYAATTAALIRRHAGTLCGRKTADVDRAALAAVVEPLHEAKPRVAHRLLHAVDRVWQFAVAAELTSAPNPAAPAA
jgi:hypothetical protein